MHKRSIGYTLDRVLDTLREIEHYGRAELREAQNKEEYDNDPLHSILKIQAEIESIRDNYYTVTYTPPQYSYPGRDATNYP